MLKNILNIHIFVSGLTRFTVEKNFHIRKNILVEHIFVKGTYWSSEYRKCFQKMTEVTPYWFLKMSARLYFKRVTKTGLRVEISKPLTKYKTIKTDVKRLKFYACHEIHKWLYEIIFEKFHIETNKRMSGHKFYANGSN